MVPTMIRRKNCLLPIRWERSHDGSRIRKGSMLSLYAPALIALAFHRYDGTTVRRGCCSPRVLHTTMAPPRAEKGDSSIANKLLFSRSSSTDGLALSTPIATTGNRPVPGLKNGMDYVKLGGSDLYVSKVCSKSNLFMDSYLLMTKPTILSSMYRCVT